MIFNSLTFLIFFLVVYALYTVLTLRWQNAMLLVASYLFYGWWDWRFLALVWLSTAIDYFAGLALGAAATPGRRRLCVTVSVCSNLGILFFFKYFNFFIDSFQQACQSLGYEPNLATLNIVLPVGISFYTFQSMSYAIDIYRGTLRPTKNWVNFALYVAFFPQLVAGPIERAAHLLPQVERPRAMTYAKFREGMWLILLGLFMKVVIADNMAPYVNAVFNHPGEYKGLGAYLGVVAFAFQIYGDFCGYSNIARGTALMMGFDLMYNFRMPYFATNPQEFWRRWHISLSEWLRDYLYVSLGGNRLGEWKTYRNLMLTMVLGGLWHGASWNFAAWGLYQGAMLCVHRFAVGRHPKPSASMAVHLLKMAVMFQFVCFGWVLFRINDMQDLPALCASLFVWDFSQAYWIPQLAALILPMLLLDWVSEWKKDMLAIKFFPVPVRALVYAGLFVFILLVGKVNGFEFIYFQF